MYNNHKESVDELLDNEDFNIYKLEIGFHYPTLEDKHYEKHEYYYSAFDEEDAKEDALKSAKKKLSYKAGTKFSILNCYEEDKNFYL
tara:strand:- start:21273 stop:21533 length:261 start_codon:yes stop_codon:yes gene_type:complete